MDASSESPPPPAHAGGGTAPAVAQGAGSSAELDQARQRLSWVLEKTGVGTWLNELPLGRLNWDEQTRRLFFIPPDAEPTIEVFWSRLHPDDREPTRLAVERAIEHHTLYEIDHRVVDPDTAQVRWIRSVGQASYGADGSPVRFDGINYDITERVRSAERLRESEERLQRVTHNGRIGIYEWNTARDDAYWNPEAYELFGLEPGTPLSLERWLRCVHPDDREPAARRAEELSRAAGAGSGGPPDLNEYRVVHGDGTVLWLEAWTTCEWVDGAPVLRGAVRDITERKAREQALAESDRRHRELADTLAAERTKLETVIATLPVGLWIADATGRMTLVNDAARRMWGGQAPLADEVAHYDVYKAWWADTGQRIAADDMPMARSLRGETCRNMSVVFERFDGTRGLHLVSSAPILTADGTVAGCVAVGQDITELHQAQERLREANASLADADRRKDEFIAVLSHELRNPLAPMRYALPVLRHERLDGPGQRALAVLERQLDQLARLVDDLLNLSRIATGKIELQHEHITLGALVAAAVEGAGPALVTRHRFLADVAEEPVWVYGDRVRLSQAITNLLDNSAKYTGEGGQIRLTAGRDGEHVLIRVRDTGVGIPPEAIPHVFEMFWQVKREKPVAGMGIGLPLVKRLVEMHGGTVEVRSDGPGQGAEFTIRLPVAPGAAPEDRQEIQSPVSAAGRRLLVLVVDDNADLVEMLALVIEAAGHDVRKALDGRSALSTAASCHPDVVVLDLGLPDMSGFDVARALRKDPATAGACLVALTGWGQVEDRRRTELAGFDRHLTKPADLATVQRLLFEVANERATPTRPGGPSAAEGG